MSHLKLSSILQDEIKKCGPIPFARFMEHCLYHPEFGYYCSPRDKIGLEADYDTSPSIHPVFAKLLGKQILQMALLLKDSTDKKITLFEFGAGEGTLCLGILDFLQKEAPDIFNAITYVLIEKSPSFRLRQKERLLSRYPHTVLWKDQMPQDQIGIVLSNEFVDALPVHRMRIEMNPTVGAGLERTPTLPVPTLKEIYVDWEEEHFTERLEVPSSPTLLSYFDRLGIQISRAPFDCEINLLALDWMRSVGACLKKGFVLTIDYGYPADQLYHPSRYRGTFLCYYQHTISENPYTHIGEQDMTSHIDFTALARAGEEVALHVVGFTDQTHFLMGLGIAQEMQTAADRMHESEEAKKDFLAMKALMDPHQMGTVFKVLVQEKNITDSISLDGLTFPAYPKGRLSVHA